MSIDLDAIRARADAATPGPWKSTDHYPHVVFQGGEENIVSTNLAGDPLADGAFVAHARQDIPALLAEVERLRYERNEANGHIGDLNDEIGRLRALVAAVDAPTEAGTR